MAKKIVRTLLLAGLVALAPGTGLLAEPASYVCTDSALKNNCRSPADKPNLDGRTRSIKLKAIPLVRKLTMPGQELLSDAHCRAAFEISYTQRHDQIRVYTTIDNGDCGASSGAYALRIRTYVEQEDGGMESVTRTVNERWQRDSEETVRVTKNYPMNGGSRVGWVRIKSDIASACLCATEGDAKGP